MLFFFLYLFISSFDMLTFTLLDQLLYQLFFMALIIISLGLSSSLFLAIQIPLKDFLNDN